MSKIFIYAICKNEESNIQTFLKNLKLVDGAVVLDTGSTDNTVKLLREAGVTVYEKQYLNFDFAKAKNDCLELVPQDVDWCVSLDFNETIIDNLIELQIIKTRRNSIDSYKVLCYGNERKIKIHKRNLYYWKYAVHEKLVPKNEEYQTADCKIIFSKNRIMTEEKLNFYHKICMEEYLKTKDIYFLWFICLYYYQKKIFDSFLNYAAEYLDLTPPYNSSFRIYIFLMISRIYKSIGKEKEAVRFSIHALSESIYLDTFVEPKDGEKLFYDYSVDYIKEMGLTIRIN